MRFIMRKFLILCVVLILTLISPIYAFADDPEESDSSGDRLATEEEIQELDDELHSTSIALYNLLSDNGTKATTHDVNDIYNWLNSYFGAGFGSNTTSYPTLAYSRLGQIITELRSINTSISNISTKSTLIYETVENIFNGLNPEYDDLGISIYDLLHSVVTALTTIDPDDGDLTLVETLVYMYNELEDMNTTLSAILNSSYSIDNKLTTIYTYLINFRSDMNTGFSNVNANMQLIISKLQSIADYYNNVSWITFDNAYLGFTLSLDPISYTSGNFTSTSNPTGYFVFKSAAMNGNFIYKFELPLRATQASAVNAFVKNISIVRSNGNIVPGKYFIEYDVSRSAYIVYLFDFSPYYSTSENTYIKIDFNYNYNISSNGYLYYLQDNQLDYYTVYQYLFEKYINNTLSKFESLYASDDLIAAKQDQQDYEDQAIQDFTGSGSAAASGQDLGDMKSISGAIKSGLQTGGSVNNALAPFNTNSGFWDWFSQSNYDNINTIPSSGLRGGHNNEPEIIDFYTNNQYTLQGLLSGGGN